MPPGNAKLSNRYPASGVRSIANGTLFYFGQSGYSWSSVVATDSNAYFLNFNDNGIYPQSATGRADALPVRCLLE